MELTYAQLMTIYTFLAAVLGAIGGVLVLTILPTAYILAIMAALVPVLIMLGLALIGARCYRHHGKRIR